jgi:hypothetical protein
VSRGDPNAASRNSANHEPAVGRRELFTRARTYAHYAVAEGQIGVLGNNSADDRAGLRRIRARQYDDGSKNRERVDGSHGTSWAQVPSCHAAPEGYYHNMNQNLGTRRLALGARTIGKAAASRDPHYSLAPGTWHLLSA